MNGRQFLIHLVVWAVICLLATTFVGAVLGFVLLIVWRLVATLLGAGGAVLLFQILGGLLALGALVTAVLGVLSALKRDRYRALAWWSTTIAFIGIDSTIWLSAVSAMHSAAHI